MVERTKINSIDNAKDQPVRTNEFEFGTRANEHSAASACYLAYGFEPCEFEQDKCEQCESVAQLYFGDRDYWDNREGRYLCAKCIDARIAADAEFAKYIEDCIAEQVNHEATHMPWML